MDIELLRTFLEVSQSRHFGRAADKLFITPAAASARIRQLEQSLGVSLFYRTRGNNQLTAEGERLLPHAHQLLEAWEQARKDLVHQSQPDRMLSVGATPGLWHFRLAELAGRLRRDYPDLKVRAEAYHPDELVERLLANQLDLALLCDLPDSPALKARKIGQINLTLLNAQPGRSLKAALSEGYISVDWGPAFTLFQARRLGEQAPVLHTNLASLALEQVRRGAGSAYLPAELLEADCHAVEGAPVFHRTLYAVFVAEREFSPGVQGALAVLSKTEEDGASSGDGVER
ncbi:LysR family transcriptional regulator [Marinimicrobium agarilyticum]|uniref:LysR family transcriptional regulator n=1 Tax=Marinimicrobium agarilyticum TaxID=306546 RepID=UPI00040DDAD4|nr:LysR family transcriptional regulator [Marinimicrobium agarilyticum]